jgi:hypothetical protein
MSWHMNWVRWVQHRPSPANHIALTVHKELGKVPLQSHRVMAEGSSKHLSGGWKPAKPDVCVLHYTISQGP